jgi:DNA-binding LytR/AlgR family response regulator
MHPLSCIIIDDEQHAIDLLRIHVQKTPSLHLLHATTNSIEGLHFLQTKAGREVDLVFLDIHMPDLNGIEFLRVAGQQHQFILTTAHEDYALQGYEYGVVDYLLKPITFDRFLKATRKVVAKRAAPVGELPAAASNREEFLFVRTEGMLQKVRLADICYVEGEKNYVSIQTDEYRVTTLLNMKDLEEQLPKDRFIRVHKSFIVAVDKITAIDKEHILVSKSSRIVPISLSNTYKESFFGTLKDKIIIRKEK